MGAFPDARINAGIDARLGGTVYLSAHTAFSATGTNEVTGGSYARQLMAMDAEESPSKNQIVRWVMAKDDHAQKIQDTVAGYWLAQRIKAPAADADEAARDKYHRQLELLHGITVAAMKCKQTTDVAHVAALRKLADDFSETYFSKEDLEHLRGHHDGDK